MGGQCAQPWAGRALLPAGFDQRTAADRPRAGTDAGGRERRPGLLTHSVSCCVASQRCEQSARAVVSISSMIARVIQPEANRTAPSSRIRPSAALPAESMKVTASSSTRTAEASRRAATLDQQRASSSTQGPASRPSSVTVAPPGRVVTEIRSIELSQGKTHAARAGRPRRAITVGGARRGCRWRRQVPVDWPREALMIPSSGRGRRKTRGGGSGRTGRPVPDSRSRYPCGFASTQASTLPWP